MRSERPRPRFARITLGLISICLYAASDASASAAGLSIAELIDIAVQDNRDLQAARYVEQRARARLVQAGLRPNPRLEVTTENDRLFGNAGEYSAGVGVSQPFPIAGRIARQKDVSRADVDLALMEIKEVERKLAGDVTVALFRILGLDRQISIRDRLVGINQQLVEVTRHRFRAAEVSELDTNAAELDLQRLRQERALLQSERTTRYAELNQLLGRAATEPLNLDDTAPNRELSSLDVQQRAALERRPDLQLARLNIGRARAEQGLARAERWEDWSVSLGVTQNRLAIDNSSAQSANRALGVAISIPLPLFNKNQGRIAETAASEAQADAKLEALALSIRNEVATAYAEAERLQHLLVTYEQETLPVSERNVKLAQKSYTQGLVTIVEVVQAQRQQGDLSVGYINTFDQYLQALAKLFTATATYSE